MLDHSLVLAELRVAVCVWYVLGNASHWSESVRDDVIDFRRGSNLELNHFYLTSSSETTRRAACNRISHSFLLMTTLLHSPMAVGTSDLATHEWSKHGSCTLWSSEEYFTQINTM